MADEKMSWDEFMGLIRSLAGYGGNNGTPATEAFKQSIVDGLKDQRGYSEDRARQVIDELLKADAKAKGTTTVPISMG